VARSIQENIVNSKVNGNFQVWTTHVGKLKTYFVLHTRIVTCDDHPCEHGGLCKNDGGSYTCSCGAGYSGENCEIIGT
jgi:hypothetical protein